MSESSVTKMPKRFWNDMQWIRNNYAALQRDYCARWIAVVKGEVVASGARADRVRVEARQKTGMRFVPVIFVEGRSTLMPPPPVKKGKRKKRGLKIRASRP